jgi:hypothetical protein
MKMSIGIWVRHDADGVPDSEIVVDALSIAEAPGVSNYIARIYAFDDDIIPSSRSHFHRCAIPDFTEKPGHGVFRQDRRRNDQVLLALWAK